MSAPAFPPYRLANDDVRRRAAAAVMEAPDFWHVTIRPPTRSGEQNRMLHAALSDIAEQFPWHGQNLAVDVWKRLCTAAWLRELGESPELIPALDGHGFDVVFERTSTLTVTQMTSLIDWVHSFGAQHGITFKEPRPSLPLGDARSPHA